MSYYEVRRADSDPPSFYFVLVASNGEVVATSEMYTTQTDAARGALDARDVSAETPDIVRTQAA